MRCKTLTLLLTVWVLSTITLALADIHYNANTYPFTYPTYGTAMGFDTDMTFQTAYRVSDIWYFNTSTVTLIGFQVQVANLLVNDFFVGDPNILGFRVTAASGTSTTKIWVGTRGEPSDVIGETSWSYDAGTKICTITRSHASSYDITVQWGGGDSTAPTYSNIAHNTTVATQPCKFSSEWTDNVGLSGYFFSYNGTGAWANETFTAFSSNPAWANKTKTLPAAGTVVGYRWYANDTSDNWSTTPIYSLTTTAVGENVVVLLNQPSDGATSYTNQTTYTFTPIFYSAIQNASVWMNVSGSWQAVAWNTSTVLNNTVNSIAYKNAVPGTYLWNIGVYNTTQAVFAAANRTLINAVQPRSSNLGHSTTTQNTTCTFSCIWQDGDGLAGYIFGWNGTGSWTNTTWTSFSGTEQLAYATATLPENASVVVQYRFWANDTDSNWGTSALGSLTTTPAINPTLWNIITNFNAGFLLLGVAFIAGMAMVLVMAAKTQNVNVAFLGIIVMMGIVAIVIFAVANRMFVLIP